MDDTVSGPRKLAIRLGAVFWFALLLFGGLGFAVVGSFPWWMIALVAVAGTALGAIVFFPRWLVRRRDTDYGAKRSFLKHAFGGVLAAAGIAALPFYYLAHWVESGPNALPLATLSNGQKTVVFQGMQHVASEHFYKSVVFDLEKALTEGYALFYEGVQSVPGRPDLDDWFNKTLTGNDKDLNAAYQKLAESCGLTFQLTYFEPLLADKAVHPSRHVVADVSYLDMKNEFDRLMRENPAFAAAVAQRSATARQSADQDPLMQVIGAIGSATREQKRLIGILCRGVMGMTTSKPGLNSDPMEPVILDFRNRALARVVADSKAEKIYITYGAAHFPGFVAELQKLDPRFRVQTLKGVRPMTLPDEPVLSPSAAVMLRR
jgi:hypothetical protein